MTINVEQERDLQSISSVACILHVPVRRIEQVAATLKLRPWRLGMVLHFTANDVEKIAAATGRKDGAA